MSGVWQAVPRLPLSNVDVFPKKQKFNVGWLPELDKKTPLIYMSGRVVIVRNRSRLWKTSQTLRLDQSHGNPLCPDNIF